MGMLMGTQEIKPCKSIRTPMCIHYAREFHIDRDKCKDQH